MSASKLLDNPEFVERLHMLHKGYIDQMYHNAGKEPPIPESLIPLRYADKKVQKGLNQLIQGAKNALYCYDQFMKQSQE